MSVDEFQQYWREVHAPIAAKGQRGNVIPTEGERMLGVYEVIVVRRSRSGHAVERMLAAEAPDLAVDRAEGGE